MMTSALLLALACGDVLPFKLKKPGTSQGPSRKERAREVRNGGGGRPMDLGDGEPLADLRGRGSCPSSWAKTGRQSWAVRYDGKTYPTLLVVPEGAQPTKATVLLHGGSGTHASILNTWNYEGKADEEGILLVIPDSMDTNYGENRWNSGKYEDGVDAEFPRDDVAFLEAISASLRSEGCIEDVYAVGFSAGSQMAQRWMCEGDKLDAAVGIGGARHVDGCRNHKKPLRLIAGSKDKHLYKPKDPGERPVAVSNKLWHDELGCKETYDEVQVTPDMSCKVWKGCGTRFETCLIEGFGHAWPSRSECKTEGADVTWEFLKENG